MVLFQGNARGAGSWANVLPMATRSNAPASEAGALERVRPYSTGSKLQRGYTLLRLLEDGLFFPDQQ
jgi:hypothetical protein